MGERNKVYIILTCINILLPKYNNSLSKTCIYWWEQDKKLFDFFPFDKHMPYDNVGEQLYSCSHRNLKK